ncbi:MAG: hypothetical protein AAFX81_04015 [Pseudomonadota bacterium]
MQSIELSVERLFLASCWMLAVSSPPQLGARHLRLIVATEDLETPGRGAVLGRCPADPAAAGFDRRSPSHQPAVIVMPSSCDNFVNRFDDGDLELSWSSPFDVGHLKIKVASSIVAMPSIDLL